MAKKKKSNTENATSPPTARRLPSRLIPRVPRRAQRPSPPLKTAPGAVFAAIRAQTPPRRPRVQTTAASRAHSPQHYGKRVKGIYNKKKRNLKVNWLAKGLVSMRQHGELSIVEPPKRDKKKLNCVFFFFPPSLTLPAARERTDAPESSQPSAAKTRAEF
jgi:hypothetical protein